MSAPTLVSRQQADLDPSLLAQIYQAKKPTPESPTRGLVANADGGYTVFSLDAVIPGRPQSIPLAERDAGKRQLAQEAGTADYLAFVQGLYNRADIVVSQDALAAQDLLQ